MLISQKPNQNPAKNQKTLSPHPYQHNVDNQSTYHPAQSPPNHNSQPKNYSHLLSLLLKERLLQKANQ